MRADPFQVGRVLTDSKRFVVPIYQRSYAWTPERQLERLFESVEAKASERLRTSRPTYPHYMGAVLLSPRGEFTFGAIPVFDIVDGQQRLTTYEIFISALRDAARTMGDNALAERLTPFLLNADSQLMKEPKIERFKLHASAQDRPVFHDLVELDRAALREKYSNVFFKNGNLRELEAPLPLRAWWYFRQEVETYAHQVTDTDPSVRLAALSAALLEDLRIIVITLDETDDAQVIFETLNSGSEPLAAMDLVRNDIFHRATRMGEDVDTLMERRWRVFEDPFWKQEAVQGRIRKPRIDFFLAHTLAAETNTEVLQTELFANYKAFARAKNFSTVDAELQTLVTHVPTYRLLDDPTGESALAQLARQLQVFDVSTAYPLVFVVAASTAPTEERDAIYRLISSYIVRRAVCGLTPKAFNTTFVRVAAYLRLHGVSRQAFGQAFADSSGDTVRFPGDIEFRQAIHLREQYASMPTRRLKYILSELEKASRDELDEVVGLRDDLTIEHVLPDKWAEHWPLPGGIRAPSEAIVAVDDPRHAHIRRRELLKNCLGNLTLLTPSGNPRLGNRPFDKADETVKLSKREALQQSLLKMNQEIASSTEWNEETIVARAEVLASRAIALWPPASTHLAGEFSIEAQRGQ